MRIKIILEPLFLQKVEILSIQIILKKVKKIKKKMNEYIINIIFNYLLKYLL
jgi:hypothetical protein